MLPSRAESEVPTPLRKAGAERSLVFVSARRLLWAALGTQRKDLAAAAVLYGTHQLGESLVPVVIGLTVSEAIGRGSWSSIGLWIVVLGADFAFLSMSYRFGARASIRAKQKTGHRVRMWLTDRVVEPAGGISRPPGDLLSRASSDANRVGAYAGVFAGAVAAVVVLVSSTILLLRFSLLLGAVILVGTVLLLVVQNLASRAFLRRSRLEQDERARATVLAEDIVRGLRVLKGIHAQGNAVAEYRRTSQSAMRASLHAISAQAGLGALGSVFTGLYLVVIAMIGGWLALTGRLGLGQLIAALGLGQFVIGPMQVISGANAAHARAIASAERIREILTAPTAVIERKAGVPPGAVATASPARLEFDDVTLTAAAVPAVSERLRVGVMTGIVCGDPIAAALLPRLLAREVEPLTGRLVLDGIPFTDWSLEQLRERVLVGFHDAALLPGSIAENLAALSSDSDRIARAAHAAFADQVIQTVPEGEHTLVGDRGESLSGGQRQRIALARLLAADPAALILHDPTTAVDAATEDAIAERVHALRAGRTTLVVTTSPAWLSRCNRIVLITADERLVGTHRQLLADPAYREAIAR